MSFEALLTRPNYDNSKTKLKTLPSTLHSNKLTSKSNLQSLLSSPKIEIKKYHHSNHQSKVSQLISKSKPTHIKNASSTSAANLLKKERVQQAYNSLSDFNDRSQIIQALKQLPHTDERVTFIDRVLERKEEIQIAALKLKAKKLEPIFNVIRRKLKIRKKDSITIPTVPNSPRSPFNLVSLPTEDHVITEDNEDETSQKSIIEKLQTKFATNVALTWLTGRSDKVSETNSPHESRRNIFQQPTKRMGQDELKVMISKKVSENSDELIRLGQLRLNESTFKKYNPKEIAKSAKSKVDSGLIKPQLQSPPTRSLKRKQTLNFISHEREENNNLLKIVSDQQTNMMKKKLQF